jgi:tRNA (guanine-N7-)-methyltransferase
MILTPDSPAEQLGEDVATARVIPRSPNPDLRPWFLTLSDIPAPPFDWGKFFGNDNPVELEVGSGRGLFLVTAATARPQTNFMGIEYDFKEGRRAARRLQKRALPNVRILGADARIVLPRYVPDGSLAALHVYFPDPWWKRRHQKRRIWTPEFVEQAARMLRAGGLLHAWTDVEEYFHVIVELVAAHAAFQPLSPPAERPAAHDMDYHTSFERKKRKLGLPIYRAQWTRT